MKFKKLLPILLASFCALVACEKPGSSSQPQSSNNDTHEVAISNEAALTAEWFVGDAARTVEFTVKTNGVEGNPTMEFIGGNITLENSNPEVVSVTGLQLSPLAAGESTLTVKYYEAVASVKVTVSEVNYDSIQALVEEITGTAHDANRVWRVKGTVTSILGSKSFTIQNGGYALYVYASCPALVGDVVAVTATTTLYNGLIETNTISSCSKLEGQTGETITPIDVASMDNITDAQQSLLANINNVTATGISDPCVAETSYRYCYITDKNDPASKYCIYVNKYLKAEVIAAINEKLDLLEKGETGKSYKANLKGILISKYNDFQFVPTSADQIELVEVAVVQPSSITVANADGKTEVSVGLTLPLAATFAPAECNAKSVTWSSSNEAVATVDQKGLVTAVAAGTATITCKSDTAEPEVKGELEITVKAALAPVAPLDAPKEGEFFFGFTQTKVDNKQFFFNGTVNNGFLCTTEDRSEAQKVTVAKKGEEGYTLSFVDAETKTIYIGVEANSSKDKKWNATLSETEFVWQWNETNKVYYANAKDRTDTGYDIYLGTYNTYTTFAVSQLSYAATSMVGQMFVEKVFAPYTEAKEGEFTFGFIQTKVDNKQFYFDGTVNNGFLGTTQDKSEAQKVTVAKKGEEGYTLSFVDAESKTIYIGVEANSSKDKKWNATLSETEFVWQWDATNKVYYANAKDRTDTGYDIYLGTYNTYTTFAVSQLSYAATSMVGQMFDWVMPADPVE